MNLKVEKDPEVEEGLVGRKIPIYTPGGQKRISTTVLPRAVVFQTRFPVTSQMVNEYDCALPDGSMVT